MEGSPGPFRVFFSSTIVSSNHPSIVVAAAAVLVKVSFSSPVAVMFVATSCYGLVIVAKAVCTKRILYRKIGRI